MPGLLVSVRSASEARSVVEGGAAVVDVKEPARGPLGRADPDVWRSVRETVPPGIPVSVALGELTDLDATPFDGVDWSGIAYRKVGLAGSGRDWPALWRTVRARLPGPPWIAVIYADWEVAHAPPPAEVFEAARDVPDCAGFLVDTWDKVRRGAADDSWVPILARAKAAGRLVVLAGGLDASAFRRLAPLEPDLFAVRGAACHGGDRLATIDPARVGDLARLARSLGRAG